MLVNSDSGLHICERKCKADVNLEGSAHLSVPQNISACVHEENLIVLLMNTMPDSEDSTS